MPRRSRIIVPNVPLHIIQRGNNRQPCFFHDSDYKNYLDWLEEYAVHSNCLIHAYVLMTNHVHLLITPKNAESAGSLMKRLGQRYVQYVNRVYKRSGTLWEGRFRSCIIETERYLFDCQRYIEMNPVRAGLVDTPSEYHWSSYRSNGMGEKSTLLHAHSLYRQLASTASQRQEAYRELFGSELDQRVLADIRKSTNGNFVLGDTGFIEKISRKLGRRVVPGQAGRPRKKK